MALGSLFDPFARYYDLDYGGETSDLLFWSELARSTAGPILELGCGTGRILGRLAPLKIPLLGVDISQEMIDLARSRLGTFPHVRLVRSDMTALPFDDLSGVIYLSADTFLLLDQEDRQRFGLIHWRRHLTPKGRICIDIFNPFAHGNLDGGGECVLAWSRTTEPGVTVTKWVAKYSEPATQRQEVHFFYDEVDRQGQLRRTVASFGFRFVFASEMRLLLEAAGYQNVQLFGDYELREYSVNSERMIFIADNA